MPDQQIFFDPERKRWKRLRRILDAIAVLSTLVVVGFIFNVVRNQQLPELLLPNPKHNYRALPEPTILERNGKNQRPARRKTERKPSDIPLNTGEGLRAAYYVQDGVIPRTRLSEVLRQIDALADEYRLRVANVFHAGDGNLHPLVCYDSAVEGEAARAEDA